MITEIRFMPDEQVKKILSCQVCGEEYEITKEWCNYLYCCQQCSDERQKQQDDETWCDD